MPNLNGESVLLLIIDPQNDFMDTLGATLPVPGANKDMDRLARFITRSQNMIDRIIVTLDTHTPDHIAQAVRWVDRNGNHPVPFTEILPEQVEDGTYRAADPADQKWQDEYVHTLAERAKKKLIIWPPHCELGTHGHAIHAGLYAAIREWWITRPGGPWHKVKLMEKGILRDTEQYGAFKAEVPVSLGHELSMTRLNIDTAVDCFDRVIVAGEALSHCVAATIDQIFEVIPEANRKKYTLIRNCTSPVGGHELAADEWLENAKKRGLRLVNIVV